MDTIRDTAREAAEDVFFGQVVINWARWFIIAAGVVLVLWTGTSTKQLIVGVLPVAGLMAMNFYLHARHMAERPANPTVITLSSLIDVVVITLVVLFWPGENGLGNPFFIMYYPAVLAFAFVMPPRATSVYTLITLVAYTGACVLADHAFLSRGVDVEALILRLVTLATMGGLGAFYWRIQRSRRRASVGEVSSGRSPLEDQ
jgi:hypothetical protein